VNWGSVRRLAAAGAVVAAALGPTAWAHDLTVVSRGEPSQDAIRAAFFRPFADATGIPMRAAAWNGGIDILRARAQGSHADWDVIEVGSVELALGCAEGLFETLDWDRIGGKGLYVPEAIDPCGVGASILSYVLAYDSRRLKDGPTGWTDFFDLKTFPGKRSLHADAVPTLEIALMGDGVAPIDVYKVLASDTGVERAFRKLDTIKSMSYWWQTGTRPQNRLLGGEAVMVVLHNGVIAAANENGARLKEVWSQNLRDTDYWVILKGTPNLDAAYKFLDFVNDPELQMFVAEADSAGMSNKATNGLLDRATLAALPTAPQNVAQSVRIDANFWREHYDRLSQRFARWLDQ
jgi:putative spermidine/putrescine transport system substrate-binding protein